VCVEPYLKRGEHVAILERLEHNLLAKVVVRQCRRRRRRAEQNEVRQTDGKCDETTHRC
jgi:hypothetical protein